MSQFVDKKKHLGFKCVYVNKKSDQQNQQNLIDCGLRSSLFLLFFEKYGIGKAKLI